ncbi:Mobile element protein [Methanosarcina sp. WH1]|nr:Mobile element protein [Methanosarcina sp. WH1]
MTAGVLISFILIWNLTSKGLVLSPVLLPIALASSALGAVLPDLIEPPRNQRHRKFFHSILCLALLLLYLNQTYLSLLCIVSSTIIIVLRVGEGFKVFFHRWVVERTFGWLGRYQRLSKDYEGMTQDGENDCQSQKIQNHLQPHDRKPSTRKRIKYQM